jgi:hypothetical protein
MKLAKNYLAIMAFSMSMLPATVVVAMPAGMGSVCQGLYQKYTEVSAPKAFAKGKTKACGWKGPGGGISLNEAKKRAVAFCVANGGDGCAVVSSAK